MTMKNQNKSRVLSKQLLMFVSLLLAGTLVSVEMSAQSRPQANLNASGILQLPTTVALATSYEISLSSFGFANETEAIQFFKTKSYDSFFIRPNYASGKATIYLDTKVHPGWTVSQWNNLLNSQTNTTPLLN